MSQRKPFIVGIGGTTRPGSSSEQALAFALAHARTLGAETKLYGGKDLALPMYDPDPAGMTDQARHMIEDLRRADGVILSSPCYHGGVSGLVKNAIDYTEEMRADSRVYFDGRAVGSIGCGYGYQGPGMVVAQLRQIGHALRFYRKEVVRLIAEIGMGAGAMAWRRANTPEEVTTEDLLPAAPKAEQEDEPISQEVARFLLDEDPVSVVAHMDATGLGQGVEDSAMSVWAMPSGAMVFSHESFTHPYASSGIEVHGTKGSILARGVLSSAASSSECLKTSWVLT